MSGILVWFREVLFSLKWMCMVFSPCVCPSSIFSFFRFFKTKICQMYELISVMHNLAFLFLIELKLFDEWNPKQLMQNI